MSGNDESRQTAQIENFFSSLLDNGDDEGDGDFVGVVAPWKPTSAFDGITVQHLEEVQRRLRLERNTWRKDPKATAWVGHLVGEVCGFMVSAEPDTEDKGPGERGRARATKLLKEWMRSGALSEEEGPDASRRPRFFVIAGS